MQKIKSILFILLLFLLVYTRFVNLTWGFPYPMHPDERNMAVAIQGLNCDPDLIGTKFEIRKCLNPHFFAYGQFPLYLGSGIAYFLKFWDGDPGTPIGFEEAVISLRIISAVSSILNVLVLLKIANLLIFNFQFSNSKNRSLDLNEISNFQIINFLVLIFSPFFIQFSHFGTTESLLMLFNTLIVYFSLKKALGLILYSRFLTLTSLISGMAIASKVSSVIFLLVPLILILDDQNLTKFKRFTQALYLISLTLVFSLIFAPHNFISFPEFLGALGYEGDVAFGLYRAFYTKQFELTSPILFQLEKIFPYALGWPIYIFSLSGFILLPFKKEFNILRLALLTGFLSNAFFYAKWTRFVSPILPLMLVFGILFIFRLCVAFYSLINSKFKTQNYPLLILNFMFYVSGFIMIFPGLAHLSIYQNPDVRFTASDWIYNNMPDGSYILSETANVVDLPVSTSNFQHPTSNYQYISFNFYDLDENPELQNQLDEHLAKADYIFIPSRRIFANHWCPENPQYSIINFQSIFNHQFLNMEDKCQYLRKKYPVLNEYYDKLSSGELGFEQVAQFDSFPEICLPYRLGCIEFNDENAEETWTVFDHPVFRIYKKDN
ncbi:hypothetical protein A2774_02925 [Candidatus Roizmanbacteria bacterium RIFCSPHIGHO2_01_FULL_39_12c]|uniref:Glycosyltransferase RgtA/B/C/D-like domain-containing protein n=1 Tax=Candidatus Roizmanbacteria bacterium RIFCSPHIGHO2_01_FULL_39_12c TaxID=1802031 RepID=A0A1F7GBQ6_9BACT|nr:MAG: hypothetical protein A2774_02925 [Candidatus Roizmanbacteria bacterium RIFCSPHIGHO2_01_FULL_39_12c]OGK47448.1 MAG: hypothetical protein A2963_04815 [Candidatus Roizmanbacteria bacterium RIFCSPLOWO2_01_FULL_40_13]